MTDSGPRQIGAGLDIKPHAYDPLVNPEYFDGVLSRRVLAFVIDFLIISTPVVLVALFIFVAGFITLGLAWFLYALLWPAAAIWAVLYYGLCFGSAASATLGMRAVDLQMRTWYGAPSYFLLGAVHAVVFWVTVSALTPLVLLVALFNDRGRLLHDMLVGTIVINNEARAQMLRPRI